MSIGQRQPAAQRPAAADWEHTRSHTLLATQIMGDEDQYLGAEQRDIGRAVGSGDRELFVSCAAGEALQQQFAHLQADFIAVHDVATRSSRQLVGGIAAAVGQPLRTLVIRRQGFGNVLATLHYADLARADGGAPVRIYSTDGGVAGNGERHAVARALLAHSRLGVMMVGELAGPALAEQAQRWNTELASGDWPNRQLLLMPLAVDATLSDKATEFGRGTAVLVRSTAKVTRASDAWGFIHAAWAQLQGPLAGASMPAAAAAPAAAASAAAFPTVAPLAAAAPAPMRAAAQGPRPLPVPAAPTPPPVAAAPRSGFVSAMSNAAASVAATAAALAARLPAVATASDDDVLARYVGRVAELDGVAGCCIFEVASGRELAHAGSDPRWVDMARHGGELLAAVTAAGARLGLRNGAQAALPEAVVTYGKHHVLLRAVPHRSGLALQAVLEASNAHVTLLRLRLERLDDTLKA